VEDASPRDGSIGAGSDPARWLVLAGLMGLVAALVAVCAGLWLNRDHFSSFGWYDWVDLLDWPVVAAGISLFLVTTKRPWVLLGAGALVSAGTLGITEAISWLGMVANYNSALKLGWSASETTLVIRGAASVLALVAGLVALLGRDRGKL
jgi:hypothetical protein